MMGIKSNFYISMFFDKFIAVCDGRGNKMTPGRICLGGSYGINMEEYDGVVHVAHTKRAEPVKALACIALEVY